MIPSHQARQFRLSDLLAIAFVASLTVPALSLVGSGLRGTWTLFGIWIPFAIAALPSGSLSRALSTRRGEFTSLSLWMAVVAGGALLGRGYTGANHTRVFATLAMVWIVEVATTAQGPKAYRNVALGTILLLGVDAARSLPSLWQNPGYPRQIMAASVDFQTLEAAAFRGVGDYHLYTANALLLPVMISFMCRLGAVGYMALPLCAAAAAAISISTLAGAFALMVIGITLTAGLYLALTRRSVLGTALLISVAAVALGSWLVLAATSDQAQFVLEKLGRLIQGVNEEGIVAGDETGRGELFLTSWSTFRSNWLLGVGASTLMDNPNLYTLVGGHSSVGDLLAEYGVVGFSCFASFIYFIARRMLKSLSAMPSSPSAQASIVGIALYVAYSFVNPMVLSLNVMALYFLIGRGYFEMFRHEHIPTKA